MIVSLFARGCRTAVLVVEDETFVRMAWGGELEDAGFEVFEAANATEAIELLIANKRIGVMFTDAWWRRRTQARRSCT